MVKYIEMINFRSTAITMEGDGPASQEQIFENIRLHKEVLESVKNQPWEMRRKLKLVRFHKKHNSHSCILYGLWIIYKLKYLQRTQIYLWIQVQQAKEYVRRHEGQLQERLAQSKSTKDFMARFNLVLMRVRFRAIEMIPSISWFMI